jgi:hypothetical protein
MPIADAEINFDDQERTYSIVRFCQSMYQSMLAMLALLLPLAIIVPILILAFAPAGPHARPVSPWAVLFGVVVVPAIFAALTYVLALGVLRLHRLVLVLLLAFGLVSLGLGARPLLDLALMSDDGTSGELSKLRLQLALGLSIVTALLATIARSALLSRTQIALFREILDRRSVWGIVTHGLGGPVPGLSRRSGRLRSSVAALLYFLGNALLGLGFFWLVLMFIPFHFSPLSVTVGIWSVAIANSWINIFASYVALLLVFVLGGWLLGIAQRYSVVTAKESQLSDPRPPVLFLRAFGDDQVPLHDGAPLILRTLLGLGRPRASLDLELLAEGRHYGPVVALGSPRDKLPPFGAARDYMQGANWQEAVATMANRGCAIVICLDDTDGVWWEVEQLFGGPLRSKTLFLLHPKFASVADNERFLKMLTSRVAAPGVIEALSSQTPGAILGFFYDEQGRLQVARSDLFGRFAFAMTLRWFFRTRLGALPVTLPS